MQISNENKQQADKDFRKKSVLKESKKEGKQERQEEQKEPVQVQVLP